MVDGVLGEDPVCGFGSVSLVACWPGRAGPEAAGGDSEADAVRNQAAQESFREVLLYCRNGRDRSVAVAEIVRDAFAARLAARSRLASVFLNLNQMPRNEMQKLPPRFPRADRVFLIRWFVCLPGGACLLQRRERRVRGWVNALRGAWTREGGRKSGMVENVSRGRGWTGRRQTRRGRREERGEGGGGGFQRRW